MANNYDASQQDMTSEHDHFLHSHPPIDRQKMLGDRSTLCHVITSDDPITDEDSEALENHNLVSPGCV